MLSFIVGDALGLLGVCLGAFGGGSLSELTVRGVSVTANLTKDSSWVHNETLIELASQSEFPPGLRLCGRPLANVPCWPVHSDLYLCVQSKRLPRSGY